MLIFFVSLLYICHMSIIYSIITQSNTSSLLTRVVMNRTEANWGRVHRTIFIKLTAFLVYLSCLGNNLENVTCL